MHFLISCVGSAGDVHPFIAIGQALAQRGHDVELVTSPHFAARIEAAGLRFDLHGKRQTDRLPVTETESDPPPASWRCDAIIDFTSTNAVLYSGDGTAGTKTTDQAAIDAWRTKGRQVGIYGDLTIRRATPAETAWVTAAEAAYHAARTPIALEDGDMFSD